MEKHHVSKDHRQELADAAEGIVGGHCYFDQVTIWTRTRVSKEQIRRIRSMCGDFRPHRATPKNWQFMRRRGWRYAYKFFQATNGALTELNFILKEDAHINYVEVGMEILMRDLDSKARLASFIERHIWQGHRVAGPMPVEYEGTIYTSARKSRNNVVMYAGKPSKRGDNQHCIKVEYRIREGRGCAVKGIRSISDLLNFDHQAFWSKQLRLAAVDLNKLELAIRNTGRAVKLRHLLPLYKPFPMANALCNLAEARANLTGGIGGGPRNRSNGRSRLFQDAKAAFWPYLSDRHKTDFPLQRYILRIPSDAILARVIT